MVFRMENERIFLFIVFYRQTDSNRSKTWFRSYKNVASIRVFASLNFQSSWAEQQYIIRKWQRKRATYTTIVNINFVMCGTESTSTHTHTQTQPYRNIFCTAREFNVNGNDGFGGSLCMERMNAARVYHSDLKKNFLQMSFGSQHKPFGWWVLLSAFVCKCVRDVYVQYTY